MKKIILTILFAHTAIYASNPLLNPLLSGGSSSSAGYHPSSALFVQMQAAAHAQAQAHMASQLASSALHFHPTHQAFAPYATPPLAFGYPPIPGYSPYQPTYYAPAMTSAMLLSQQAMAAQAMAAQAAAAAYVAPISPYAYPELIGRYVPVTIAQSTLVAPAPVAATTPQTSLLSAARPPIAAPTPIVIPVAVAPLIAAPDVDAAPIVGPTPGIRPASSSTYRPRAGTFTVYGSKVKANQSPRASSPSSDDDDDLKRQTTTAEKRRRLAAAARDHDWSEDDDENHRSERVIESVCATHERRAHTAAPRAIAAWVLKSLPASSSAAAAAGLTTVAAVTAGRKRKKSDHEEVRTPELSTSPQVDPSNPLSCLTCGEEFDDLVKVKQHIGYFRARVKSCLDAVGRR